MRPRVICETDLGVPLDKLADHPQRRRKGCKRPFRAKRLCQEPEPRRILLRGIEPWEAWLHNAVHQGLTDCPVCGGNPTRRKVYCTFCDASTEPPDERGSFPVGHMLDAKCPTEYINQPAYHGHGAVKGGKG